MVFECDRFCARGFGGCKSLGRAVFLSMPPSLSMWICVVVGGRRCAHTLYFSRSSLERGALMIVRGTLEGAEKCALRDFLLEEDRAARERVSWAVHDVQSAKALRIQVLILVILSVVGRVCRNRSRWSSQRVEKLHNLLQILVCECGRFSGRCHSF